MTRQRTGVVQFATPFLSRYRKILPFAISGHSSDIATKWIAFGYAPSVSRERAAES
jgi:hypothetical protein